MKKNVSLFCFLFSLAHCQLFAASYITGPDRVCPGQYVTYVWHADFSLNGCAAVGWKLKVNGVVIAGYSSTSSNHADWLVWSFQWPATSAVGDAEIDVEAPVCCHLCDWEDDYYVRVGMPEPTGSIGGPNTICPSASETYYINAIGDATSYTWEVPSGWTVNGIAGPIVSGQGNSVSLSTATSGGAGYVKVRGDNATCGSSSYLTTYIQEDYHPIVTVSTQCSSMPEFDAFTQGAVSYDWQVPSGWYIASGQGTSSMMAYNFDNSGFVVVMTETVCGTITQGYYYYDVSSCSALLGAGMDVHPNPMSDKLLLRNKQGASIGEVMILNEKGEVVRRFEGSEKTETIGVSDLKPGTYYLKYKQDGNIVTERLIKN